MFCMLKNNKTKIEEKSFKNLIRKLPLATGITDVFNDPITSTAFRAGSAIEKMAVEHGKMLISYTSTTKPDFDLSEGFK